MNPAAKPDLDRNWMGGYVPDPAFYDEFIDAQGQQRPHWKRIAKHLGSFSQDSWERRKRQLERLIHENGITYNVYGEDSSKLRPWSVDMIPLSIAQGEMAKIESALSQRAHLLNLILSDIYGRQNMLQNSRMPPYLVFANPSFLRPCHGLLSPRHKHIQLYAADLARSPDGNWWVLSDRVEAASGLGYALENRMLMSRIFPKAIWEADILSLQPFVQEFCRHIESLAATASDTPNIALLTAGPHNETYFEQSFLARNLGYTLAEGEDLTVRNNRLYMKTINGVQQIHGLLRRVDSSWVDSLELRNESLLGVPGLVNTIRQGNLSVINGLGAGFIETPALSAFLPWFCRSYLGESLELPSVATWWCGQAKERDYVIANIENLIIKPTFRSFGSHAIFGPKLDAQKKADLIARIKRYPERYCGQEIVSQATTPVYENGKLHPRHFLLRVFLVPSGSGWKMMPGGLVRYAPSQDNLTVSMQHGGESKDAWVMRDNDSSTVKGSVTHFISDRRIRRSRIDLPSRTADNLFWLGRYIERAESLARLLRALCRLLTEETSSEPQNAALPFLEQIIDPGQKVEEFLEKSDGRLKISAVEPLVIRSLFDTAHPESLLSNLRFIERAASKVKERLSNDTWKRILALGDLGEEWDKPPSTLFDEGIIFYLDNVLESLSIFTGNVFDNMTRSQGWCFLEIGRRIERSLLQSAFATAVPYEETLVSQLLNWADSSITYRRRYLNTLQFESALDLLCFDATNPRALIFQASQLQEQLSSLPHSVRGSRNNIDQLALQFFSRIGINSPENLLPEAPKERKRRIEAFFSQSNANLIDLANAIQHHYFAHTKKADPSQQKAILG